MHPTAHESVKKHFLKIFDETLFGIVKKLKITNKGFSVIKLSLSNKNTLKTK